MFLFGLVLLFVFLIVIILVFRITRSHTSEYIGAFIERETYIAFSFINLSINTSLKYK